MEPNYPLGAEGYDEAIGGFSQIFEIASKRTRVRNEYLCSSGAKKRWTVEPKDERSVIQLKYQIR
jgi:hypothetical protein